MTRVSPAGRHNKKIRNAGEKLQDVLFPEGLLGVLSACDFFFAPAKWSAFSTAV